MGVVSISKSAVIIVIILSMSCCDGGNYYRVDLIRRETSQSPLMKSLNLTKPERVRLSMERSKKRVERLQAMARGGASSSYYTPLTAGDSEFIMQLGVGSPSPLLQHVIADTGSDLIWVQCKPKSTISYNQTDPLYNPHASPTYKDLSCNSKFCTALHDHRCNRRHTCEYTYGYGDGASTIGDMATETFSLKVSASSGWKALPPLVFGCGHRQEGPTEPGTAGLVGLGRGALSLPSQLGKAINNKFSYCLGPVDDDAGVSALFLGDARLPGYFQSTPLVRPEGPNYGSSYYYVELQGISVGGTKIKYPASAFQSGGLIIDSGTTLTLLPDPVYEPFLAAVKSRVRAKPVNAPDIDYDLCYDSSQVALSKLPRIAFHFAGNAAFIVPPRNSIVSGEYRGRQVLCLAYNTSGSDGETSIFGNIQQQNYHIVYDLSKNKLSFAPAVCDNL